MPASRKRGLKMVLFIFCIPCLALLIYFCIVAIFVPSKRPYVALAWHCFTRKLLMRPCEVSFDEQMKAATTAWFIKHNHNKTARFINQHFSDILTAIFIISLVLTIISIYFAWQWWFLAKSPCEITNVTNSTGVCVG